MWKEAKGRNLSTLALDLYLLWQFYTTFGLGAPLPGRPGLTRRPNSRPVEDTGFEYAFVSEVHRQFTATEGEQHPCQTAKSEEIKTY
jgi:hypothetical protein